MPEKVHTKFGDQAGQSVAQSTVNTSSYKSSSQYAKVAGKSNDLKRSRDGNPKATANTKPDQPPTNTPNTKKQRTNFEPHGRPNATSLPATTARTQKNSGHLGQQRSSLGKGTTQAGHTQKSKSTNANIQRALKKTAQELEELRKNLPIWSKKADIRWALRNNDVLLLNGETGSGKSTQTPQFLYNEPWCKKQTVKITNEEGREEDVSVGGMIAITEPRRVAAITLARRVAMEMGSYLGKEKTPGSVGYSVRFDSVTPLGMKIKFVTEGMLLQEMLRDPHLRQYSAVIVDEIHERSVDVDLIAGFLRQLVHGSKKGRGGIPLKVVIMSATMDLGGLETFFAKPGFHFKYKPGKNHGQDLFGVLDHLKSKNAQGDSGSGSSPSSSPGSGSTEAYSSWEGISSSDESDSKDKEKTPITNGSRVKDITGDSPSMEDIKESRIGLFDGDVAESGVAVEYVEGRQHDVKVWYETKPSADYLHNVLQTILRLHISEPLPGDILAFLTGQEEIETLQAQLEQYASQLTKAVPRMKIMPLYGSLSAQAQQEVFEKVKETRTRKVVLATNIAETSVTVSGVRFVIDCGKSKVKQYRPRLGMESLLAKPISKTSAIQRAGRAGREAPGKCYRIYTPEDFARLEADQLPEILRSDVVEAVLKMKARGVDDVLSFPLMDSPDVVAMEKALVQLHSMGAIDDHGTLTETGKNISAFPLPAAFGRVLVAAAESDCVLEAIDVISCLTTDSEIFIQAKSEADQESIEEHRKDLQHRQGDILTYLNTMQRYAAENSNRNDWCKKRLVSVRAMKMALAIRKQLRQICHKQKLLAEMPPQDPQPVDPISEERAEVVIKSFLKAFAIKTAVLGPDGAYYTSVGRNIIAIHPSSVMFGKKVEAIMFLDHVFTAKSYAKKVSFIQANWIVGALGI
ncbi:putative ATP-dependent RNA helicase prh1 [Hyphodiscus hymeniophilus]|uniref:RNA helicase n=1 Tax=Hyphodiscus hymeniophilus TaxID=353542 RepID=A0A9P6VP45_9HELO|nr:putative ATP-dependent RNA helicase prh1 [Hyphodiscus hymeniophilus]